MDCKCSYILELKKICLALDCNIEDIVEIKKDEE
ncbi:hypothetical protein KGF47_19355 [Clostridioides sp. ZZV13-5731]|nr:hypothetical protein [Clostridioides sp. ZZV13-5731]